MVGKCAKATLRVQGKNWCDFEQKKNVGMVRAICMGCIYGVLGRESTKCNWSRAPLGNLSAHSVNLATRPPASSHVWSMYTVLFSLTNTA